MTKTLRPVFRLPDAAALDDPAEGATGLDAAEVAAGAVELDELELQAAARPTVAITGSASASFLARLRFISLNPFNSVADRCCRALDSWWRFAAAAASCRGCLSWWLRAGQPARQAAGAGQTADGAVGRCWAGRRWRGAARR